MAKLFFRVVLIVLFPSFLCAQSLDLSVSADTKGNSPATFLLSGNKVKITSDQLHFSGSGKTISNFVDVSVSADQSVVSILKQSGEDGTISVFNTAGELLTSYSTITLRNNDPSKAIYASNSGSVLLRDNITNFTFYDVLGEITASMSNSSQSKDGEKISQIATNDDHSPAVIYNPKIKRGGDSGSRAKYKRTDSNFEQIFNSRDRYLKDVIISDKGDLVVLLTAKSGTQDQAIIMDAYGNVLNTISVDDNLKMAAFSSSDEFITLSSSRRVMVYSVLEGEKLGSTSLDTDIFLANYFPEDDLILAMTGNRSSTNGAMKNSSLEAINLKQRSIASKELPASVGFSKAISAKITRLSDNEYRLEGGSRLINIQANF